MNDKGLDLLDQKDLILKQAQLQLDNKEITREQYDVSIDIINSNQWGDYTCNVKC